MAVKSDVEIISTRRGYELKIIKQADTDRLGVTIEMNEGGKCLLHWGLTKGPSMEWQIPPQSLWPMGTVPYDKKAVQTPFRKNGRQRSIFIRMPLPLDFSSIPFVLSFPEENSWDNNAGKNYTIDLSAYMPVRPSPVDILKEKVTDKDLRWQQVYQIDNYGELAVAVVKGEDVHQLILVTNIGGPLRLHWGVALHSRKEWEQPPESIRPQASVLVEEKAVQTPFFYLSNNISMLEIEINIKHDIFGIPFVLYQKDANRWFKDRGRHFFVPVGDLLSSPEGFDEPRLAMLGEKIISAEMSPHSWTLMHRFNLCHDLLDQTGTDLQALSLLMVWLRFSAIRQLDWQRNYNTKPRELSHSQDRLTLKLADLYAKADEGREMIRLMFTTLGPGAEGQQVRDGILEIMHRHHIKEVTGHFLEEWHQKLHNNTTPDDVVICEAYLAFLRADGDHNVFYGHLDANGVSKERLEGYERPIKSPPDFIPDLKEGLIVDFESFLKTLKALHTGLDLESNIHAVRGTIDDAFYSLLDFLKNHYRDPHFSAELLVERLTEARGLLAERIRQGADNLRDLLFLDLSLEVTLRRVIEGCLKPSTNDLTLVVLTTHLLTNATLSFSNDEMSRAARQWIRIDDQERFSRRGALLSAAALERLERALGAYSDQMYRLLQPKAEWLGKAFQAERWSISLFSEEIIRGTLAFMLSRLVYSLYPILRKKAHLGDWQLISRGFASGRLVSVKQLQAVQNKSFPEPSIIIADQLSGYEEIPHGVTAIITGDKIDLLSHLAIRVRNAGLLLAICYNRQIIQHLHSLEGRYYYLKAEPAGDITFDETKEALISKSSLKKTTPIKGTLLSHRRAKSLSKDNAILVEDFEEGLVGAKSLNLKGLRHQLPDWIHLPLSMALPFGVFQRVLACDCNRDITERYRSLTAQLHQDSTEETTAGLRREISALKAPEGLLPSIGQVMAQAGLAVPPALDDLWPGITAVWASLWNERAYLNRTAARIAHEDILMAVLIQQVIEAQYAFVIHSVNPFSDNKEQLYGELVLGLGETLVSNYPGQALGFTGNKQTGEFEIITYPSKSEALYGKGLIFRSDSSGEDLYGYAGAGLYSSIMLEPAHSQPAEYIQEPLIWDRDFMKEVLTRIINIGAIIEKITGSAQDIEGVYSDGKYYVVQTRPQVGVG